MGSFKRRVSVFVNHQSEPPLTRLLFGRTGDWGGKREDQMVNLSFPVFPPHTFTISPSCFKHVYLPPWQRFAPDTTTVSTSIPPQWEAQSVFSSPPEAKSNKCLWFLRPDGSSEFVFNLGLSQEHTGFSPKIGSRKWIWGGEREERREEEERGVWLMSTRCLTFGGSHIL